MWLINVDNYSLNNVQDVSEVSKQYAILSHRWEEEEVSYNDIRNIPEVDRVRRMKGWYKIAQCCETARQDGLQYAWVDTCCIDKSSSAELQEAINSMFRWYSEAKVCYVFLSDVSKGNKLQFVRSQWFKRGWTLQELVAPEHLDFYDRKWQYYGNRNEMKSTISKITRIPIEYLIGFSPEWVGESAICVAEIMSWASKRKTTRVEDRAYSLIGLFGVSMPLLYGEGDKAFRRLQEELLRSRDDQSIFAWRRLDEPHELSTALADSPDNFARPPGLYLWLSPSDFPRRKQHLVSNEGVNIELDLLPIRPGVYHAMLNALLYTFENNFEHPEDERQTDGPKILSLAFPVRQIDVDGRFVRLLLQGDNSLVYYPPDPKRIPQRRQVTLVNYLKRSEVDIANEKDPPAFSFTQVAMEQWSLRWTDDFFHPSSEATNDSLVHSLAPETVSVFCKWEGWPHKLCWSMTNHPIQALGFGFDFDFNPVCVVIAGDIKNEERLTSGLNHLVTIRGDLDDRPADSEADVFSFSVKKGTYSLRTSTSFKLNNLDGLLILAVKSTQTTRVSGAGLSLEIFFGRMFGQYYSGGCLRVKISRGKSTNPWQVDLVVQPSAERNRYYHSQTHTDADRVSPFPARRLGTWAEATAADALLNSDHNHNTFNGDEDEIL